MPGIPSFAAPCPSCPDGGYCDACKAFWRGVADKINGYVPEPTTDRRVEFGEDGQAQDVRPAGHRLRYAAEARLS